MATILLTGSRGLIGTAFRRIIADKHDVIECDIAAEINSNAYGDILDLDAIKQKVKNCDGIIHLAAVSRVIWGEKDPELCNAVNVTGTKNVLHAALSSDKKPWVVYASSREVYGQQNKLPVAESVTLNPVNVYGKSKYDAEHLVKYFRGKGLNTVVTRFSNVYGSIYDHSDRVIPAFCYAAAHGSTLRLEGSQNTFDFTYIDDVAEGVLLLVNKLLQNPKQTIDDLHFVSGIGTTLQQAAEYACAASDKVCKLEEAPPRDYDVAKFYGDPGRAQNILNWQATTDIKAGIAKLVKAFNEEKIIDFTKQSNLEYV